MIKTLRRQLYKVQDTFFDRIIEKRDNSHGFGLRRCLEKILECMEEDMDFDDDTRRTFQSIKAILIGPPRKKAATQRTGKKKSKRLSIAPTAVNKPAPSIFKNRFSEAVINLS